MWPPKMSTGSRSVTLFGKKVFADMIKLKVTQMKSYWIRLAWCVLNPMARREEKAEVGLIYL